MVQSKAALFSVLDPNKTFARTRAFFEQLGLPTRLSDYGLGETDIEIIITQLKSHNLTQLGEHKNVSLEISRQILETSI